MKLPLFALLCMVPLASWSQQSDDIILQFPKVDVRDVLVYYELLSGSSVFAALDIQALVTVQTEKPIPRTSALDLIRATLLDRYGIELRAADQKTTLVAWSKDPKYPRRSDEPMTKEERGAQPRGNIRIIKPAETK